MQSPHPNQTPPSPSLHAHAHAHALTEGIWKNIGLESNHYFQKTVTVWKLGE